MSHIGNNVLFVSWLITWKSELGALTALCCQTCRNESGEGGWRAAYSGGGLVPEQHLQTVTATCVCHYINKPKQNAAFSKATGKRKECRFCFLLSWINQHSFHFGLDFLCFASLPLSSPSKWKLRMRCTPSQLSLTQHKNPNLPQRALTQYKPASMDRPWDLMRRAFFSESSQLYIAPESQPRLKGFSQFAQQNTVDIPRQ